MRVHSINLFIFVKLLFLRLVTKNLKSLMEQKHSEHLVELLQLLSKLKKLVVTSFPNILIKVTLFIECNLLIIDINTGHATYNDQHPMYLEPLNP